MKLFYLPGSCALGPHIALEYRGLAYEAVRVERGRQTSPAYLAVNPLGRVPALVTEAHGTITEAPVVLSYIADLAPERRLLPEVGTSERYEAMQWMAYISSTVHPALGRLWRAERFCDDAGCEGSVEHAAAAQLANDFAHIDKHCRTGDGSRETISPSRISTSSSSGAWASGSRRAHAIFRTSTGTRWRSQASRRRGPRSRNRE